jgi:phosphoglycerol transferase MdoB-like AlkP superfamily enzyme
MRNLLLITLSLLAPGPCLLAIDAAQGLADASHDMTVVSHEVPSIMARRSPVEVTATVRNDGSLVWSSGDGFALAYHWLTSDGKVVEWEGRRAAVPGTVGPGESVHLQVMVETPAEIGPYLLELDMVQENVCWFSERDPTPVEPVAVQIAVSHAFSIVDLDLPRWLWAGDEVTVPVRLRNDGTRTWQPQDQVNVSYHWFATGGDVLVFEGVRTPLPAAVAMGETVDLGLCVQAPQHTGKLLLAIDLVEEGVCWFSQRDLSPEPTQPLRVLPASRGYHWLVLVTLVVTVMALLTHGRIRHRWLLGLLSLADVVWAGTSLVLKQPYLLHVAGREPDPVSWWISTTWVVLVLLLLFLSRQIRPWLVWAAAALGSLVILADVIYLRYFDDVISMAALSAAGQVGEVRESIVSLLAAGDLWLVADLLPAAVLVTVVRRLQSKVDARLKKPSVLALLPLLIPGLVAEIRIATAGDGTFVQVFHNLNIVERVGLLGFHLHDTARYLRDTLLKPSLSEEQLATVENWFASRAGSRTGTGPWFGVARDYNLLMIQVESLQGYLIGYTVNGQEVTPNLNRWRRHMLWFSRLSDQAAHGRSSDCELSSQTSLLPWLHGSAAFRHPGNDFVGIAEVLAGHGYSTLSAVPYDRAFWNRQQTHPAYGYATNLFKEDFAPGEVIGWGLNDREFLAQIVPRLSALPQPFCAYLLTLSLHHPFAGFPAHHKRLDVGQWDQTPFGNYLHTMHFLDAALAEMVAEMDRAGLLEGTVIAVWGDHGSGLYWSRELAAAIGRPYTEADFFDSERVPLLVRVPSEPAPHGEVAVQAGQFDIAPTLLALLGIDPGPLPFMGRNLLGNPGTDPVSLRHGHWVSPDVIYANHGPQLADGRCFDAATLEPLPVVACEEGNLEVRRQAEVARLVLSYDLQQRIGLTLKARETVGKVMSQHEDGS